MCLLLTGCSRYPSAPAFPAINPASAASDAIEHYDASGDGVLSSDELAACPPLADGLKRLDQNGDGSVSQQEIEQRLRDWLASGTSLVGVIAQVTLDGAPLQDAKVTLEPETFLGAGYQPAVGATDASGMATFAGHDPRLPGLHLGFYRVRISKPSAEGKERLPDRYNTQSELGVEIAADHSNLSLFELVSR